MVRQLSMKDGLLSPGVKSVYKDSKGFIWFAFSNGIARYDGYTFKTFDAFLDDSCAINPYKYCTCFFEDRNGDFWIGTLKNGFAKLDRATEKFTYFNEKNITVKNTGFNTVFSMLQDSEGDFWLGTGNNGLVKFDPVSVGFRGFLPDNHHDQPNSAHVYCMLEDKSGNLWLGTGHGIYRFDKIKEQLIKLETVPKIPDIYNKINCIEEDQNGNLWFGTDWGLFRYEPLTKKWNHYFTDIQETINNFSGNFVSDIMIMNTNSSCVLWISTGSDLLVYDYNTENISDVKYCLNDNKYRLSGIKTILNDNNNLLWLGGTGVTLIDPRPNPFSLTNMYSVSDPLVQIEASCFYEEENGRLWVGSKKDGLFLFDQEMKLIGNYLPTAFNSSNRDQVIRNCISTIYNDSEGNLWVGTAGEGLSVFNKNSKTFHTVNFETIKGRFEYVWVSDILEDSHGMMWFATQKGLFHTPTTWHKYHSINPVDHKVLANTSVSDLMEDSKGRLWVITYNKGVFCLKYNNNHKRYFHRYFHKFYNQGLFITKNARSILEDNEENIWLRSEKALFRYNERLDSIEYFEKFGNAVNYETYEFATDKNGNLWFISQKGLIRFKPKDNTGKNIKIFGQSDGLYLDNLVNTSFGNSRTGYLYIGGSGSYGTGFIRFKPDSIYPENKKKPAIVITGFKIRNENILLDSCITYKKHIKLKYYQNFITIEFATIDFRDPSMNQHAYLLEGFEEDWNNNGNIRTANYTGIPPGNYVFRVIGSNSDGYWNYDGSSIVITVMPPPWKTWWAYTLYILFVAGIIYIWRKYELKRLKLKQSFEIELIKSEKLKELDRIKSKFFANISHEFRTPLTLILGPIDKLYSRIIDKELKQDLAIMQRNARRLQHLINQLLSLSRLESGKMKLQLSKENIVFIIKGYVQAFESLAKQREIELEFQSEPDEIFLYFDREKMGTIIINLLSNAFRFTGKNGKIKVSIAILPEMGNERSVEITLSDNGQGISADDLPHIFDRFYKTDNLNHPDQEGTGIGLALAKELIELHHGTIAVKSRLGAGTEFSIRLSLSGSLFRSDEFYTHENNNSFPISGFDTVEQLTEKYDHAVKPKKITYSKKKADPILLIVEDNLDLLMFIKSQLSGDYNIYDAFNGLSGLEKAIDKIPDLIISDVMMPGMNGYELTKRLKNDPRTSHIPIILLTAKADKEDKLEGLEAGADDFLIKPFDIQELEIRVKNLIAQRKKLRAVYLQHIYSEEDIPLYRFPDEIIDPSDKKFIEKAVSVIEMHLADENFTVEAFGKDMALSRVQIYRKLNALTGMSATAFVRLVRLNYAARLLREGNVNVTQAAYQSGFNNLSWFAKCFQEQFGKKPSDFTIEK